MRKILFSLIIVLLLTATVFTIVKGFDIGNISIWGVKEIIDENELIDTKNAELSNLVSITYPTTLATLDSTQDTLTKTKKEYEDAAIIAADSNYYAQSEKYEIEFLWTKLGNYAKDENVQIRIDVTNSSTTGLYDLNFTIEGTYVDVINFIYDIENDSRLGFTIENFSMSASSDGVKGTFSCKEIGINLQKIDENTKTTEDNATNENTTDTSNTTGNTNTTGTQNTTNTNTTGTTTNNNTDVTNTTNSTTGANNNKDSRNSTTDVFNQYTNE